MGKIKRPEVVEGKTHSRETGCGTIYVTVNTIDGKVFETFLFMGKGGGCASCQSESVGRLVSYISRIGGEIQEVIKNLKGVSCHAATEKVKSCSDAVAQVLEKYLIEGQ